MKEILFILFLFPFMAISQKDQFATSINNVFIKQNHLGKFGIINGEGDTLLPIVNDYVKELRTGGGFVVYEEVITNDPNYKTGILRFYNNDIEDIFNRTFTRISDVDKDYLICYDHNLCGVFSKKGETVAPICFTEITFLGDGLFLFKTENYMRDKMENILSSKTVKEGDIPKNTQRWGDGYSIFQGLFNSQGELICKGQFRMIDVLIRDGKNSLLLVQNQQQYIDRSGNANFAVMKGNGELVSDYIYWEVQNVDGKLIGGVETEKGFQTVILDKDGTRIRE